LKNLPLLQSTNIVSGREQRIHKMPPSKDRWKLRSITYQGIADAMAAQWGKLLKESKCHKGEKHGSKINNRINRKTGN
jgi:hypothetical protein